ncbi:MAG: flagellar filament capping protein FliD [Clostridia bacterium]|nr:flagellar filament capping protein FliD [Clostridia bacterium]
MSTTTSSTSGSGSSSLTNLISSKTRMGGLISGMDTDTLVEQLTSSTRSKIAKLHQMEQKTEWKRDAYRSITTQITDFSNKYFSYINSSNNILSSSFFDVTSINSSSGLVNISGNASTAQNMVVKNISGLAAKAGFTSTKAVSNNVIKTGTIYNDWKASDLSDRSFVINYNGKDYTLKLDSDFELNSHDTSTNAVDTVISQLNKQINNTEGLEGNVQFTNIDSVSGTIQLTSTDPNQNLILKKSSTDLKSQSFLNSLGFTDTSIDVAFIGFIQATDTNVNKLYNNNIEIGSSIDFTIDGTAYTLELDKNIDLSECADDVAVAAKLAEELTTQIQRNVELSGKINVSATDGQISFSANSGTLTVTGGSENLLNGLGIKSADAEGNVTYSTAGTVNRDKLVSSYLGDELSGSTINFTLNGITKKITLNESDKASFDTAAKLNTYLQSKLDNLYGTGKVNIDIDANNTLSFTTADNTSVLSVSSSDNSNITNVNGALRVGAGESNRLETAKTLEQLASEISGLTADASGNYVMNINGKEFSFAKTTKLSSVISTINNDANAGVTVSYSSTTDTFSVSADDSGSQGSITISDAGGNLAASLFGTAGVNYTVKSGTDAVLEVSFDGGQSFTTITRTENTFTLDGVSFELTGKSTDPAEEITFTSNSNVDDLCTKIVDWVNEYNKIMDSINKLISTAPLRDPVYEPLTEAQKTDMTEDEIKAWEEKAKQGILQGNPTLQNLAGKMREAMTTFVNSTGTALYQIGITSGSYTDKGQLTVNKTKLKEALSNNLEQVTAMFTGEDGISQRIKNVMDNYTGTDGILVNIAGKVNSTVDQSNLTKKIADYEKQIKNLTNKLEDEEDRYWNKFTAMEQALSLLEQQSSYLTSMLSS